MKAKTEMIAAGVLIVGLILFEVFTFGKSFGRVESGQLKADNAALTVEVIEWKAINARNEATIRKMQGQIAELLEIDALNRRTIATWESNAGGIRRTLDRCMDELEHRVGR